MSAIRLPNLSKLHSKPVVRCECDLIQFQTGETCRRCKLPFAEVEVVEVPPTIVVKPVNVIEFVRDNEFSKRFSAAMRLLRLGQGMTQLQLAIKAGTQRSHVSRRESGKENCYQSTIETYAGALGVTPYGLLLIAEAIQ